MLFSPILLVERSDFPLLLSSFSFVHVSLELDEHKADTVNPKQRSLVVNINFAGPVADATPHLAGIEALNPNRSEVLEDIIWPDVFGSSYFGIVDTKACGRNQHVNMRSVGARRTDPDTILAFLDELESFSEANPDLTAALVIHRFATQKVLSVPDEDTSYQHRGLDMHM